MADAQQTDNFERARSSGAKQMRERAILDAARSLAVSRGVREITLTDIAAAIGMHKSALLRYFETREQIFLKLTAAEWREWAPAVRAALADARTPHDIAAAFASTLVARPLFCDLLAHVPLNLERHVSLESVREFKLVTHEQVDLIIAELRSIPARPQRRAGAGCRGHRHQSGRRAVADGEPRRGGGGAVPQ